MADSEEFALFMTLPFGVEQALVPGVLASRNVPFEVFERYPARQMPYIEIVVPVSRLDDARRALEEAKKVGELLDSDIETTEASGAPEKGILSEALDKLLRPRRSS